MPSSFADVRRCRPLLGTFVEVTVCGHGRDPQAAVDRAFARIEGVQRRMSFHDPASDVSRINRDAARTGVRVHADTWRVLDRARRLSRVSGGLFDVTVGGSLVRWGLLPAPPGTPRPAASASFRDVVLLARRRVRLRRPALIDLGGIAKGFAVDRAVAVLREAGACCGCVNAGGDLRVFGPRSWPIAVRLPALPARVGTLLEIRNRAVATSGGYFGRRRRGRRLVTPLVFVQGRARVPRAAFGGVTVTARTAMTADALTKIVLGDPASADRVLARHAAEAVRVDRRGRLHAIRMSHTGPFSA